MRLKIVHSVAYEYTESVYLEPHQLRLAPRSGTRQFVISHSERVTPTPRGTSRGLDLEGNEFGLVWFEGSHESLKIEAETVVETVPINPFDYLITAPACAVVPAKYPDVYEKASAQYRERSAPSQLVTEYAWSAAEAAGLDSTAFLLKLAQKISSEFDRVDRPTGPAREPAETLKTRFGACRDLAALYIDACRSLRLAARYVSGYLYDPFIETPQLHAWAEVFLPGAGWRGYDPSMGLAETEAYVSCVRAASLNDATPVRGTFRSSTAESTMTTELEIIPQ